MQPVEASQRCVVLAASGGRVGIPECQKYLDEGKHRRLYRFSPDDYEEAAGIWSNYEVALPGDPPGNLEVVDGLPEGGKMPELLGNYGAFAPDYAPD